MQTDISGQNAFPKSNWPMNAKTACWGPVLLAVLGMMLAAGCATPIQKPSKRMQKVMTHAETPPLGKSLVIIHHPREGYKDYTDVWDSTNFMADLGTGQSIAYVCEPGVHYFINRSPERAGVVEANLLPDKTYVLSVQQQFTFWISSFQIEPVKRGTEEWEKAPKWAKQNMWATNRPSADYEAQERPKIEIILRDYVGGKKDDRLRHMGPDDHR